MSPFTYFLAILHTISLLTPLLHSTSTNIILPSPPPFSNSMNTSTLSNTLLSSTNIPVVSNIVPSTNTPALPSIVLPSTSAPVLSNTLLSTPQLPNTLAPSLSTDIPILSSTLPSSANNNPPVVTLSRDFFTFIEGSPPLLIGDSITLTDADSSNLSRIMFIITDVPDENRFHNELIFENNLGFIITTQRMITVNSYSFTYTLENNASISDYQTIVSSVRYNNTFEGDFVSIVGNRTIEVFATDSQGAVSQSVRLTIAIEARDLSSSNTPVLSNTVPFSTSIPTLSNTLLSTPQLTDTLVPSLSTNIPTLSSILPSPTSTPMLPSTLPSCGNGMLDFREECDHNSAGCNPNTCMIYPLFNCEVNDTIVGITNCSYVLLDTNTSNPFSVDSEYSTNQDIFRLNMEFVNVGIIYTSTVVEYRLSFSRLDNPEINSNTNPITVNIERLTEIFNLTSLTIEPNITLTENATVFVNTYSITQDFLAEKSNTDLRECILGFINATQVDISDRPVGKLSYILKC